MTDPRTLPEEDDALAAEHALGLLTGAEAAEAERRVADDPAFRAAVAAWQERLVALADEVPPVAPPARVARGLEATLFAAPPGSGRLWGGLERLRGVVFGALAASVVVAALAVGLVTLIDRPALVATLGEADAPLRFEARYDARAEGFVVTRVAGQAAPAGQAHELWLIAPDAAPVSLGLVGEGGLSVAYPEPPAGWTLAVSLEPEGGSPTGAPTGPVLAAGEITEL